MAALSGPVYLEIPLVMKTRLELRPLTLVLRSAAVLLLLASTSAAQLRIVTFNTANNGDSPTNAMPRAGMDVVLQAIGDELVGGIAKPLDVLSLQEQQSVGTTTQEIVNILNGIYGAGTYARGVVTANSTGGGRAGLIYNTQTVQLLQESPISSTNINGAARQPMRYKLRPVGYGADADFYVYSNHYKSSTGATNESRRQVEAAATRANADGFGEGTSIIYTGDFNIQSSSEAMYQTLLSSGAGQAFDPINRPGNWHNSSSLRITHTQSPYNPNQNDPDLIAGGLDDRFDFQLVTGELLDNEGMSYISGSYHAFGNNGSHALNDYIDDSSNTALPSNILAALAGLSDHLPVVADYQVPARMLVETGVVPSQVLVGAIVQLPVTVSNSANVVAAHGADELDYTLFASGAFDATIHDMDAALGGGNTHVLFGDTSTLGTNVGLIRVDSTSQSVADGSFTQSVVYSVLDNANASFDVMTDLKTLTLDFGVVIPGSEQWLDFDVFNTPNPLAAGLDLDDIIPLGDTSQLTTDLAPFSNLPTGQGNPFRATLATSMSGSFSATYVLQLSDQDLPGIQTSQGITLSLVGGVALPGDANLDGIVDTSDFNIWNENKFGDASGWMSGDFNADGIVDTSDFNLWNMNKFTSIYGTTLVPEPGLSLSLLGTAGLLLACRRRRPPLHS